MHAWKVLLLYRDGTRESVNVFSPNPPEVSILDWKGVHSFRPTHGIDKVTGLAQYEEFVEVENAARKAIRLEECSEPG